jgi:hypothetical protein
MIVKVVKVLLKTAFVGRAVFKGPENVTRSLEIVVESAKVLVQYVEDCRLVQALLVRDSLPNLCKTME